MNWNNFNNVPSGIVSSSTQIDTLGFLKVKGDSVISGSSQVNANSITNFDANVLTYINGLGSCKWFKFCKSMLIQSLILIRM